MAKMKNGNKCFKFKHKINIKNKGANRRNKTVLTYATMDDRDTLITSVDDLVTSHRPNNDLVSIFNDTRERSNTLYADYTAKAKEDVRVLDIEDDDTLMNMAKEQKISFRKCGTVAVGYDLVQSKEQFDRVAILNFADALVPGGLVLIGAPTQEENICRCSNLYETLLECPLYYNVNRMFGKSTYLDVMIYSKDILVFKDDVNYHNVEPLQMDVITCPAPSCYLRDDVAEDIFTRRIRKFLIAAQKRGVNKIVLGAWGCGAFGQDPSIVGKSFAKVLKEQRAFDEVVFAIKSSEGLNESRNYTEFKRAFEEEYDI